MRQRISVAPLLAMPRLRRLLVRCASTMPADPEPEHDAPVDLASAALEARGVQIVIDDDRPR